VRANRHDATFQLISEVCLTEVVGRYESKRIFDVSEQSPTGSTTKQLPPMTQTIAAQKATSGHVTMAAINRLNFTVASRRQGSLTSAQQICALANSIKLQICAEAESTLKRGSRFQPATKSGRLSK